MCNDSIVRVLPVKNDLVNQDCITDKTRFCLDAFEDFSVSKQPESFEKKELSLLLALSGQQCGLGSDTQFIMGGQLSLEQVYEVSMFCSRFNFSAAQFAGTSSLFSD